MEYLRENNDFVTEKDGLQKISTACILLFGKNPQRFFPRARTRFIRYKGTEEKVGTEMNVVKEFGEGIDRICNELETKGCAIPSFPIDAFILKDTLMAEWTTERAKT